MNIDEENSNEETISEAFRDVAQTVDGLRDGDVLIAMKDGRRRRLRRQVTQGALAALMVVGIGASVWRVAPFENSDTVVVDNPEVTPVPLGTPVPISLTTTPAPTADPTPVPTLEPTVLPTPAPSSTPTTRPEQSSIDTTALWAAVPDLPFSGREQGPVVAWTGSRVVIIGGASADLETGTDPVDAAWDPATGAWTTFPGFPVRHSADAALNGGVYMWGGLLNCPVEEDCPPFAASLFLLGADNEPAFAAAPSSFAERQGAMSVSLPASAEVLFWGGFDPFTLEGLGKSFGDGVIVDTTDGSVEPIGENPFGQRGTAIVGWHNGDLIVGAGEGGTDSDHGWYRYRRADQTWTAIPSAKRFALTATGAQVEEKIIVWGGDVPAPEISGAILDLETDTWSSLSDGPTGRVAAVEPVVVGSRIAWLFQESLSGGGATRIAVYDIGTDRWADVALPPAVVGSRILTEAGASNVMVINGRTGAAALLDIDAIPEEFFFRPDGT